MIADAKVLCCLIGTIGFSVLQMETLRLEEAVPKVTWLISGGPGLRLRKGVN